MKGKLFAMALLFLLIPPVLSMLSFPQNPMQAPRLPGIAPDPHEDEHQAQMEKDMAKKANRERQAQLQKDADSLLKLANELKQSVDKSNENTLSVEVVKKAEEIEKLAHSVKEKMKAN